MYVKNVKSVLYFTLLFLITWCKADVKEQNMTGQQNYKSLEFSGAKPNFSKKVYTAFIDGISMELEDAITLDNCHSLDMFFEFDARYAGYVPLTYNKSLVLKNNCTLFFPKILIKTKALKNQAFAGFITIRAIYNKYIIDATSVILIPRSDTKDLKIRFEVNGTEYIILNYFYFKIMFFSVVIVVILVLLLEIKEIYDRFYRFRYRHFKMEI